jgi:hypothetical protein
MSKTGVAYTDVGKSDNSRLEDDHIMNKLSAIYYCDSGCYLRIAGIACSV